MYIKKESDGNQQLAYMYIKEESDGNQQLAYMSKLVDYSYSYPTVAIPHYSVPATPKLLMTRLPASTSPREDDRG